MPAGERGGSRVAAKPRAKAPASPSKPAGAKRPGAKAEGPVAPKLSPQHVLMIAAGVLSVALIGVLATGGRAQHLAQAVGDGVGVRFGDAGFALKTVHVQGASAMATSDIVRAAAIHAGDPLIGMDLEALRGRVQSVGWVKEARVVRLLPDTLVISVKERRQLAVWQHNGKSVVIDDQGQVIREADPARFASLPLVVGSGGAEHASEILPILVQRPKLMSRMEALVRVDDRRWDMRLKDGALIQLPAVNQEEALIQLEQLDLRSRILELGFERIDLRNPDVVAVRPRAPAPPPSPAAPPIEGV